MQFTTSLQYKRLKHQPSDLYYTYYHNKYVIFKTTHVKTHFYNVFQFLSRSLRFTAINTSVFVLFTVTKIINGEYSNLMCFQSISALDMSDMQWAAYCRQRFVYIQRFETFYRAAWNAKMHGVQTRFSDENSVCPSVKRVYCDKTEEKSVQIFIPYEKSFSL